MTARSPNHQALTTSIVRPLEPWRPGNHNPIRARLLRAMFLNRRALLAIDPWLPVPQTGTTFGFGPESRSLPIGALFILWRDCKAITGLCPRCGGLLLGYTFGGLLSTGGCSAACVNCEHSSFRWMGGFGSIGPWVRPMLASTPFVISSVCFGGDYPGHPEPLLGALHQLSVHDLPSAEELRCHSGPRISVTADFSGESPPGPAEHPVRIELLARGR